MAVKTWGDFEVNLDRLIGRGGMGAVYMGRQMSLDRPAAIKVLKKDLTENPEFVKRFYREAALLARLVDNHVVQVFGAGQAEGEHFYAMEFVEGEDFASRIHRGVKFTADEVLRVAMSVGLALHAAWGHRIVHRDIKPSNILLTKDNKVKVMDFGLAKNPESDLTVSEVIMGTAKYMSPEQATGAPCDARSDLYSLGVVLYELSTGQPPFTGEGATAIMYQQVHKNPRPPRELNPAIPEDLEKMILRLMAKDPEARFPSADALVFATRCIQEGVTPDEKSTLYNYSETIMLGENQRPIRKGSTVVPPPAPKSSAAPLAISLVVLLLGVGGYYAWGILHADPPPAPPTLVVAQPLPVDSPPKPPPPPAWEDSRNKGLEAFNDRRWFLAYTLLDEAGQLGAKDVTGKKLQARANECIEKAEAEVDDEVKIQHYEAARKFVDNDALRQQIKATSFRRWRKNAEKVEEGGDWSKAAADWQRVVEFADEAQVAEFRERQNFCARFSEAVSARTSKDWPLALEIFKELGKNPRNYSKMLEGEIERAEKELAGFAKTAVEELQKEFDALLEQACRIQRRAVWTEAKAVFDRMNDVKYAKVSKTEAARYLSELALALAPPPGMAYVPAGTFTMGGGRAVEAPEGEAQTSAYFIDEHEVTAGEYAEFLKALVDGGHHPGCFKEEPAKIHVPADWERQDPQDAVVGVDWWDATSYAAWRKKRLPREAEWEKAAGFDPDVRRLYAWGSKYVKEGGKSHLGLSGMGTGVIEWTSDWFQKYRWSAADHADFGERKKVLRGGVLLAEDAVESAKATFRNWYPPGYRSRKVGFRCVQDVPAK
jgi:serine/threonine protein kinase/formylglycine-generating enzyme required for sulfatase activity